MRKDSEYEAPRADVILLTTEQSVLNNSDGNSGSLTVEDAELIEGIW